MIFKEEDDNGRERVTEEERITIKMSQQRSNFGESQVEQQ